MPEHVLENFVGGAFSAGTLIEGFDDLNPSDREDRIGLVPEGSPDDVAGAVEAAANALSDWRRRPGPERAEHLHRWAGRIGARLEEIAQALAREVGKPIGEARGEVARCVSILRYYAGEAVRSRGEVVPAAREGSLQFTLREPLGVVGLITPWNFPVAIPLWKAAPALAFGNAVVLKPSEESSHVAVLLAETASAAELPPGVFNVVLGSGEIVGEALLRSEPVRGVSFTGSVEVGARVASICAERSIRYQTEMGGKNVVIVLPDADLDRAAFLTAAGAMRYAGQKCTATSRAVVATEVEGRFLDRLRREIEGLRVGPVTEPSTAIGPLISDSARARVQGAVAEATTGGAEELMGAGVPTGPPFDRGFFLEPALVRGADPNSRIGQEELFGPVLATFVAEDVEEAISIANRSRYGLSASLFTRDLPAALSYIDRIEVGLVRVNGDTTGVDPHAPFGGMKASSSGTREQGPAAREFFTQTKTVQVDP